MSAKNLLEIRGVQSRDQFIGAVESLDTIEAVPLYYGRTHKAAPKKVGLMNARSGDLVGVASDKWMPVNHTDAFSQAIGSIAEVVGRDDFYGRVINSGNLATMEVLFGNHSNGDNLAFGLRVSNNYRVGTVLKIESLFVRSACTNGMLWSDNTASLALSHISTIWNSQIANGVYQVVDRLEQSGRAIGSHIDTAKTDIVNYAEFEPEIRNLGQHYMSTQGWNRLQKSSYGMIPGDYPISRYDVYNMLTAYGTHLQSSQLKFNEIQKGAQHVLTVPFEQLFIEAIERISLMDPSAGVATA
jgi:hypothetical protein